MKDTNSFGRAMGVSLAWHVGVVLLLAAMSLVRGCRTPPRPRETLAFIELVTPRPAPFIERVDEPSPPRPEPPPPEPEPRWRPAPVQRSDRRITRTTDPDPAPAPPPLSEEEIRRRLREAVAEAPPPPPRGDPLAGYLAIVRQTMHEAWTQPSELTAAAGHRPVVRIRVQRDGRITARALVTPSGNARMDASVMAAAERVDRLPPLPAAHAGAYRDIDIGFEISR